MSATGSTKGRRTSAVVPPDIADDQVQTIHAVPNPEKLQHLDRPVR